MRVVFVLLFVLCLPVEGWAKRVALVIGNSDYTTVVPLDNPKNDSAAVSRALTEQGFEVIVGDNLGRVEMRDALRRFRTLADSSEIALVYYAGHGIEIAGTNYLVPVDARLEDERDAGLEMVEVDLVLRQISGARTLKMVVLDACRNNPFVVRMQRQGGSNRSVGQGLGEIRSNQADTLISYAAAAGDITPDGQPGENSPFTAAFLASLEGPPMDVRRMLGQVRDQMRLSVPGAAPFVYSSLGGGEYIINPRSAGKKPAPVAATAPAAPAPQATGTSISQDFVKIDRDGTVQDWNEFLIRHEGQSSHPLYAFALEKRAALQGTVVASRAPDASVTSDSPPVSEPSAPAAQDPTQSGEEPIASTKPAFATTPVMTVDQAAKSLQTALKDKSCYTGRVDGLFGRNSRRALAAFSKESGVPINLPASPDASQLWAAKEVLTALPDIKCPPVVVKRTAPAKPKPQQKATSTKQAAPKPQAPVVAEEETDKNWSKKKKKGPVFSTLPCPKSDELRMRRPECH